MFEELFLNLTNPIKLDKKIGGTDLKTRLQY